MSTKLDIYNMALTLLGQPPIASLTDTSKGTLLLNAVYDLVRDDCLREHHWNFSIIREDLVADTGAPVYGYDYHYVVPPECLKIIETDPPEAVYETENLLLLTDEDEISLKYVSRIDDETIFDTKFTQFFATRLAAKICYNLTASPQREQTLHELAARELAAAKAVDGQEDSIRTITMENTWLDEMV